MIKIYLNRSEIQVLINLLISANYTLIEDYDTRVLTKDKIGGVLRRLIAKLSSFPITKKEAQIGFKPAETAALHQALKSWGCWVYGVYEETLVNKINMIIEQKTA